MSDDSDRTSEPVSDERKSPLSVSKTPEDVEVERRISRLSRRSLLWGAGAVGLGLAGQRWLTTRRPDDGLPWPFRRVLEVNEQVARDYYRPSRLAPTFPNARVGNRVNGDLGLSDDFDVKGWTLSVEGLAHPPKAAGSDESDPGGDGSVSPSSDATALTLTQRDIQALPRVEMVTELKCIEGWSVFVHWAGVRFADFIARYPPPTRSGDPPDVQRRPEDLVSYVSLSTPDEGYYVGLEMESALQPQTLLCYEMNGKPLTQEHGAPLRLVIPVKYGIKNIKRIGTIRFTNTRPADYWAEQGYDWYAGH